MEDQFPSIERELFLLREVREAFRNNIRWYYRRCRDRGSALTREELLRLIEGAGDGMCPL